MAPQVFFGFDSSLALGVLTEAGTGILVLVGDGGSIDIGMMEFGSSLVNVPCLSGGLNLGSLTSRS